jgi:GxxExxY protein
MQPPRRRERRDGRRANMRIDEFKSRNVPAGEEHDELTERIIGAAIEVHTRLGAGLGEALYKAALCCEFDLRGIRYQRQVPIAVEYKGAIIGEMRLDLVVEERVIVELKACDSLNQVHRAQCITYLTVTKLRVALLINFNVAILRDGIKRIVLSK